MNRIKPHFEIETEAHELAESRLIIFAILTGVHFGIS